MLAWPSEVHGCALMQRSRCLAQCRACVEGCFECIGRDVAGKELFLGLVYTRTLEGCLGFFVCLFVLRLRMLRVYICEPMLTVFLAK